MTDQERARLTLEEVARFPRPGMAVPGRIAFAPDSKTVTFLYSAAGSLRRDLWQMNVASGARSLLLAADELGGGDTEANMSLEEQLRRERERLRETGITHYEWAEAAPVLLVPVRGDLYVRRGGTSRRVARDATDAHLSRDGRLAGFVRDGDLYVVDTESGEERRLTHDAASGVTNGLAEFIAQEEMHRRRGYWLSRDGTQVAFARIDERHIPLFRIAHAAHGPYDYEEHRYPFAGEANARVTLGVVSTDGGAVRWLDLRDAEYLARVDWSESGRLLVQVQSRDQRRLELREYDTRTGAHRTLLVETAETWINLHDDLRPLRGERLVWASERSGFKHLYLYEGDRLVRALTSGAWMVDAVVGTDERFVTFTGTKDSPLERHVYRVPLDGGEIERLTDEPGMHDAVVARDGSALVVTSHNRQHAPRVVVRRAQGSKFKVQSGEGGPEERVLHEAAEVVLAAPEILSLKAADGTALYGALYRPPEGTRYPAPTIVQVYGGPHAQTVQESWLMTVNLRAQYLASRGFVVWLLDNRGSARRGLAFESALHRQMGTVEVEGQVAGVRYLVEQSIADPQRVGIYGWSYGGYMTLMCLMQAPEVFRAGVAGAPVVEWEGYDTHYTERYMETPEANPDGYRKGSVLAHVDSLQGALLVTHGMIDENVHFRHTARLLDALVKANKPHELLLFPDERHMPRAHKDLVAMEARIAAFFERELARA